MKVGQYFKRSVVAIGSNADIAEAARLMRTHHVGFLVVLGDGDVQKPVGVLTDRDIVLQVVAREVDPGSITVQDVMTRDPMIATEEDLLGDVLQAMRFAGIRRVPVVDVRGALSGIIAIDDAIELVAGLLCDISGSIKREQTQEQRTRPA